MNALQLYWQMDWSNGAGRRDAAEKPISQWRLNTFIHLAILFYLSLFQKSESIIIITNFVYKNTFSSAIIDYLL